MHKLLQPPRIVERKAREVRRLNGIYRRMASRSTRGQRFWDVHHRLLVAELELHDMNYYGDLR